MQRAGLAALIVFLGFAGGGCSYQLGSMQGTADVQAERTASIGVRESSSKPSRQPGTDNDLTLAKAAATEVLATGKKDASRPWENPRTGARGTVTPIATAYNQDGFTCRDFLASHVHGVKETWYQGGACRVHGGRWQVRDIRPLQRT
jgi:surface antigen